MHTSVFPQRFAAGKASGAGDVQPHQHPTISQLCQEPLLSITRLSPEGSDLLLLIRLALLQLAGEAAVSKVFPKKRKTCSQTVKGYSYIKSLSAFQRKQNNIFSLAAKPVWRQTFSLPSSLFFMVLQKWGKYWLIG